MMYTGSILLIIVSYLCVVLEVDTVFRTPVTHGRMYHRIVAGYLSVYI